MAQNVVVPPFDVAPETVVGSTPQNVFPFDFPFWEKDDILVYVDGAPLSSSAFTVAGYFIQNGEPVDGGYGSGQVTLSTPVSNRTVTIDRFVKDERRSQFSRAAPLGMPPLNADLNKLTARDQDLTRYLAAVRQRLEDAITAAGSSIGLVGKLDKAANLGDVASTSTARENLGLGDTDDVRHNLIRGTGYVAAGSSGFLIGYPGTGGFKIGGGDPRMGPDDGSFLGSDGHGNWVKVQSARSGNPTELIVYSSSLRGRAQGLNGTSIVQRISGSMFTTIQVGDAFYFAGRKPKVSGKPAADQLAVTWFDGSAISFDTTFSNEPFNWIYTTGSGKADIVSGQVRFISGTPFPALFFRDFRLVLNGVTYAASDLSFINQETYAFTGSPPANASNVDFTWRGDINDQNTTLRVQLDWGADEENVNVMTFSGHPTLGRGFHMTTGVSGLGKHRPLYFGAGYWAAQDPRTAITIYPKLSENNDASNRRVIPDGGDFVSIGGLAGNEALRVKNATSKTANANRIIIEGAAAGFAPSIRAMGSDTNISMNLDVKALGRLTITSDQGRPVAHVASVANINAYPVISAGASGVTSIVATGTGGATNADLLLDGSGTGGVRIGTYVAGAPTATGYITLITKAGQTIRIPAQLM